MLQHSSLPTTSPAEIADSLQRSLDRPFGGRILGGRRWQDLHDVLPLPTTWQQYLLACLAIAIVAGGMCLQVLLSVQIARAEYTLRQMRGEYARIERQNSELVYAIAQQSSLVQMAQLAAQKGYVPATGRTYLVRSQGAPTHLGVTPAAMLGENPIPTTAGPEPSLNWLEQTHQWWRNLQQAVGSATGQLWRDVTGRME